jgi:hypothetical protein
MSLSPVEILRQQLREKFPQAHGLRPGPEISQPPAADLFGAESFPIGGISEVIPAGPGAGLMLLIAWLLGDPEESSLHPEMVLVDGADGFDPNSFTGKACSKLLWIRCIAALPMLKAVDLVVRDGNLPFVLLDTTGLSRRDLAALPASAWWRLKQSAERNGCRVVVLAHFPLVPCAALRLTLTAELSLRDFDRPREELLQRLRPLDQRLRQAT